MRFADSELKLTSHRRRAAGQPSLDRIATELFALFQAREAEFGFNPQVFVEYPELGAPETSPLLLDPSVYIDRRIAALEQAGDPIGRIVILTTFGDKLAAPLAAAGYRMTRIDMPAGPDFTCYFEKDRAVRRPGRTLYVEAVNEADEKIRPSFALQLHDGRGELRGGACGAVHDRDGARFCYLSTMTLDTGLPPGTGRKLGEALIDFLRMEGVGTIHLGTQTAGPFYEKLGFSTVHRVVPDLRVRRADNGSVALTDLVMMERVI
ncbi:GNAT family N-acetyltransferase [Stigmatella hybrida]|uniref:hypothetical protein n=1 Tax=Stigmatella hybrida TaxID=394097 RepID=UPI001CDACEF1|nr:hypothetical protein [Stigmatella hybrida]